VIFNFYHQDADRQPLDVFRYGAMLPKEGSISVGCPSPTPQTLDFERWHLQGMAEQGAGAI
jgi:hypothetical protein